MDYIVANSEGNLVKWGVPKLRAVGEKNAEVFGESGWHIIWGNFEINYFIRHELTMIWSFQKNLGQVSSKAFFPFTGISWQSAPSPRGTTIL